MDKTIKTVRAIAVGGWAVAVITSAALGNWSHAIISAAFAVITLMACL